MSPHNFVFNFFCLLCFNPFKLLLSFWFYCFVCFAFYFVLCIVSPYVHCCYCFANKCKDQCQLVDTHLQ
jgi:hypothetical protein